MMTPKVPPVEPLVRASAAKPYFSRAEAIELGYDDRALRLLVRAGLIVRVRHGTYAIADHWSRLDSRDQHLVLARAATSRMKGVVLSHVTAAIAHGMEVWGVPLNLVHITRTDAGAGRIESGVHHHECFSKDEDLVEIDGMRAVNPARAALETGILGGTEAGLVTADSGLGKLLFTPDDLTAQYRILEHWPGALPLQLIHRLADPLSESVAETRCGYLFFLLGIPAPTRQLPVYDVQGRFIGRVDFAWPEQRIIVEFDGDVKYRKFLRPGESPEDAVIREKRREDALRAAGWTVIRLCWADLTNPPRVWALLSPYLHPLRPAV